MNWRWPRSLQMRLALQLTSLYLVATAVGIGALIYQANEAAAYLPASAGADSLAHSVLWEFVFDVAWVIPILMAVTLIVGVLAIRHGLRPLREASRRAAMIGPDTTTMRLPETGLPSEIAPLVAAVNQALARLDAIALDVSAIVDLGTAAAAVVATMAPWAIAQGRTLAFADATRRVCVKGNAHAIEDAVRNLIENAVAHAPVRTEVVVSLHGDGRLEVSDRGRGVRAEDRQNLFKRFWRGKHTQTPGAGLGLAIVSEIMTAHGGGVSVADNPGGGAVFTLAFNPTA